MRLAPALAAFLPLALPAFAQEATKPPIDWSKPVVGVDGNILQIPDESAPRAIEVYTIDALKVLDSPSVGEFLEKKPAQPCDPRKQGAEVLCAPPQVKSAPAAPKRAKD